MSVTSPTEQGPCSLKPPPLLPFSLIFGNLQNTHTEYNKTGNSDDTSTHPQVLRCHYRTFTGAPLAAQTVKRLPAMQETRVRSLGLEDPLEEEMATQPSILAWRVPWTEEPGRLQSMGSQELDTT